VPDRTLIIAEAGVNHNGSLDLALQLVDVAVEAGADIVKFQTFKSEQLVTAGAARATYQVVNTEDDGSQLAMLRRLQLSPEDHVALAEHCETRGIRFMSTAFDAESLAFLSGFEMPAIKIPSGDLTFGPMLLQAARMRVPLIISTGMSTLGDVEQALGVVAFGLTSLAQPGGRADFETAFQTAEGQAALKRLVTLLHCTTEYPAPLDSVNLRAMDTLRSAFGLAVGYSDHTMGISVPIAAAARGASVIEKHFTLDRAMPGPDHAASLEPRELSAMVDAIRAVEHALGSRIKGPDSRELGNRAVARRSLVAARPIAAGEILTEAMLGAKRPGHGVSPMQTWDLLGMAATRDYATDDLIET